MFNHEVNASPEALKQYMLDADTVRHHNKLDENTPTPNHEILTQALAGLYSQYPGLKHIPTLERRKAHPDEVQAAADIIQNVQQGANKLEAGPPPGVDQPLAEKLANPLQLLLPQQSEQNKVQFGKGFFDKQLPQDQPPKKIQNQPGPGVFEPFQPQQAQQAQQGQAARVQKFRNLFGVDPQPGQVAPQQDNVFPNVDPFSNNPSWGVSPQLQGQQRPQFPMPSDYRPPAESPPLNWGPRGRQASGGALEDRPG